MEVCIVRSDRKFLSMVLAIVLVIGVCVPCFAEEAPAEEIIIEAPAEDVIIEDGAVIGEIVNLGE